MLEHPLREEGYVKSHLPKHSALLIESTPSYKPADPDLLNEIQDQDQERKRLPWESKRPAQQVKPVTQKEDITEDITTRTATKDSSKSKEFNSVKFETEKKPPAPSELPLSSSKAVARTKSTFQGEKPSNFDWQSLLGGLQEMQAEFTPDQKFSHHSEGYVPSPTQGFLASPTPTSLVHSLLHEKVAEEESEAFLSESLSQEPSMEPERPGIQASEWQVNPIAYGGEKAATAPFVIKSVGMKPSRREPILKIPEHFSTSRSRSSFFFNLLFLTLTLDLNPHPRPQPQP